MVRIVNRPSVALTLRVVQAERYHEPRDAISHDWLRLLSDWGMTPLLIPNLLEDAEAYFDGLAPDLLVMTGGDDPGVTPERDSMELRIFKHAMMRGCSVLGVCRGMQMLNLFFGGSLASIQGHVNAVHQVNIDSRWKPFYGPHAYVNSFHNLGIGSSGLADDLIAIAIDDGGMVEAFVHRTAAVAAVMWHPERQGNATSDRPMIERLISDGAFWA